MTSIQEKPQTPTLQALRALVTEDLAALDQLIIQELTSSIPLIKTIVEHIVKSGGKRLRPLLVLLTAHALGPCTDHTLHRELAAVIEFMHTATLLHDDVVDDSSLRRGKKTANALWGNEASVLIGDFLYARSFEILTRQKRQEILSVFATATRQIVEGEVLQLMHREDAQINLKQYFTVIERKTAQLFTTAAEVGALSVTQDAALVKQAAQFGYHIGMAFQIVDDILDYMANKDALGKTLGDDAAEGKYTLPVILALQEANAQDSDQIRAALAAGGEAAHGILLPLLTRYNAFEKSFALAERESQAAIALLEHFPDTPYRASLLGLAQFSLGRGY